MASILNSRIFILFFQFLTIALSNESPESKNKSCYCFSTSGNYCGSRTNSGYLGGTCNDNELFYCSGGNGLPASSKGVCLGFCNQGERGLDYCPLSKMVRVDSPAIVKSANCPSGWTRFNNKCYLNPPMSKRDWNQANRICKGYSAHLLKIESAAENNFLINFTESKKLSLAWMWARNIGGVIKWMDNTPLTYSNWFLNQPDGRPGYEECVEFLPKGSYNHSEWVGHPAGVWNNAYCSSLRDIICETSIVNDNRCTCHYGTGNYCGSRKDDGFLQEDCNSNELYYCPGGNGLPALSKGNCAGYCMQTYPGLDACPLRKRSV